MYEEKIIRFIFVSLLLPLSPGKVGIFMVTAVYGKYCYLFSCIPGFSFAVIRPKLFYTVNFLQLKAVTLRLDALGNVFPFTIVHRYRQRSDLKLIIKQKSI